MKIFNFTNGCKGKLLGERRISYTGGCIIKLSNGKEVKVSSKRYIFAENFGNEFAGNEYGITMENVVEELGVEAICFCMRFEHCGEVTYEWRFLSNRNWLNENRKQLAVA